MRSEREDRQREREREREREIQKVVGKVWSTAHDIEHHRQRGSAALL